MQLLRAADRRASPWKNGGGETWEVASFPPDAGWADFDWRISIARVEGSGPFSLFPGIDRTLAVLDGTLQLTVRGQVRPPQTSASPPARFDGDAQTFGRVIEGPVTDLNLMLRRGICQGSLAPLRDRPTTVEDMRVVIITEAFEAESIVLNTLDALMLPPGEALPAALARADGWIVSISV